MIVGPPSATHVIMNTNGVSWQPVSLCPCPIFIANKQSFSVSLLCYFSSHSYSLWGTI